MLEQVCFFIGHRDTPEVLYPALSRQVEQHITEYAVTEFVIGCYGSFDRMAARAVKSIKKRHPSVALVLLLPYHPADRPISAPEGFDRTFYPPGMETVPKRAAIVRANRYMVEHSQYLIACSWQTAGNTRKLMDYALRREQRGLIRVTNLASLDEFKGLLG